MEFGKLAERRYSVRSYRRDAVEEEKLQQVLEAARIAPTAANRQPFRLIVIHTAGREVELGRMYRGQWFLEAPIVICACGVASEAWMRRGDGRCYCDVDVAIAVDHLVLAATDLGLGTCWIGAFDAEATREVLGLPEEVEPIALVPLGYPADQPKAKKRKALDELVRYEGWEAPGKNLKL